LVVCMVAWFNRLVADGIELPDEEGPRERERKEEDKVAASMRRRVVIRGRWSKADCR
jgi:hypothetical protein